MNKRWQKYHTDMNWTGAESYARWLFNTANIPVYDITVFPNQFEVNSWLTDAVSKFLKDTNDTF